MKTRHDITALIALLSIASGCESVRAVGSACPGGVCMQAAPSTESAVPCLVSSLAAETAFTTEFEPPLCLSMPLHVKSDGTLDCTLVWSLVTEDESWCTDAGMRVIGELSGIEGAVDCEVTQVAVIDGALADAEADGWYYDDFSPQVLTGCLGETRQRIALTDGLAPPSGARALLHCVEALASAEDSSPGLDLPFETVNLEISSCTTTLGEDTAGVGDACVPRVVPEWGFQESEAYLQTGASDCETGACLVYHLAGDPTEGCEPSGDITCPTDDEIAERVYCTCRCDDGTGDGGCDCPDGFSCVDTLRGASDRIDGGYCVRNGAFSQ